MSPHLSFRATPSIFLYLEERYVSTTWKKLSLAWRLRVRSAEAVGGPLGQAPENSKQHRASAEGKWYEDVW